MNRIGYFFGYVQSEVGFSRFLVQAALFGNLDPGWNGRSVLQ